MDFIPVKEKFEIIVDQHPNPENLNKRLLEDIEDWGYDYSYATNVKAKMSNSESSFKSVDRVHELVNSLLNNPYNDGGKFSLFNTFNINWYDTWVARYDIGDYTIPHCHNLTATYSFVYFIQCPKGSSPLVFTHSNKRIKAEEGKLVVFDSSIFHHVPKNKCNGRIVLAGNGQVIRKGDKLIINESET